MFQGYQALLLGKYPIYIFSQHRAVLFIHMFPYSCVADHRAAAALTAHWESTPLAEVTVAVGGGTDDSCGGGPLLLTGVVVSASDGHFVGDGPMLGGQRQSLGRAAVLRVHRLQRGVCGESVRVGTESAEAALGQSGCYDAGFDVVIASNNLQVLDQQTFKSQARPLAALVDHTRCCLENNSPSCHHPFGRG